MLYHNTTKELPFSERPYEKFLKMGPEHLTDADLLAIIIKNGTKDVNSIEIATQILKGKHNNLLNLYELSYKDLTKLPGIGKVKAIQLKAIAELSKRISMAYRTSLITLNSPESIALYYMESMRHLKSEKIICAFFNSRYQFIGDAVISDGSVNYAMFDVRDIFSKAFEYNACVIVLLHNHPSGNPSPSGDDDKVTYRIRDISRLLNFHLGDHIIIGDNQYYSYKDNKRL